MGNKSISPMAYDIRNDNDTSVTVFNVSSRYMACHESVPPEAGCSIILLLLLDRQFKSMCMRCLRGCSMQFFTYCTPMQQRMVIWVMQLSFWKLNRNTSVLYLNLSPCFHEISCAAITRSNCILNHGRLPQCYTGATLAVKRILGPIWDANAMIKTGKGSQRD